VLDAQHFGVAQRRARVFAVGHSGDWRYPAAVLFEPESLRGNTAPRRQAGERVTHSLAPGAGGGGGHQYRQRGSEDQVVVAPTLAARNKGGGGLGTDFDCDGGLIASHDIAQPLLAKANSSHRADAESYVAMALNAKGGMGRIDAEIETFVTHALRADGFDASEDGTGRGTPLVPIAFAENSRAEVRLEGGDGQTVASLKTGGGKAGQSYPAIASPLCAGYHKGAGHNDGRKGSPQNLIIGSAVRRLTPRECERLQGFPDDYTLIGYRGKQAADGPRYKALGNSMAVPVVRWILSRIEQISAE
jgi:DNA (cytosine-5)-methyltransferase 1